MVKEIAKIHTACKNCIFSISDPKSDITQINCDIGRLDHYKKCGCDVLAVYDEEKEFFVINNVECLHLRDHNWAQDKKEEEWLSIIDKEISIKYQAIVIANGSLSDLQLTIDSLVQQDLPPIHISVIRPCGGEDLYPKPRTIIDMLQKTGLPWRSENMVDPDLKIENHVDIIIDFEPQPNYSIFHAGFNVPKETFSKLNTLLLSGKNINLALLPNKSGNGFTTSHSIHLMLQGNKDFTLIEKLQLHEKLNKFLKPVNEVISCFPK